MTTVAPVDADALLAELVATPEGRADPYPRYARLRSQAPVHRSMFGFWTLTRYDDCQYRLRPLVRAVTAVLELVITSDDMAAATAADVALVDYFAGLVAERRAHPGDDLLSHLIAAEADGDQLSEHELISTAILLFAAGFE